jgi:glutamine amidotransferase
MKDVIIVDSGGANLASLRFALKRLGASCEVTTEVRKIMRAHRVLLPGVGAAGQAMRRLRVAGLSKVVRTLTQPVLGVCLGMQLLFERSEEGETECLGVFPHTVRSLNPAPGRPVPHTGWNTLRRLKSDPLLDGLTDGDYAYFVHSYASPVNSCTLASAEYGMTLSAIVRRDNFWGTQFHPERSSATGAQVLQNFLRL